MVLPFKHHISWSEPPSSHLVGGDWNMADIMGLIMGYNIIINNGTMEFGLTFHSVGNFEEIHPN